MPRTALTFPKRKTVENLLTNGDFEYAPPFTAATNTTSRWIDGTAGGSGASQSPYTWGLFGASLSTSAQFDTAQTKTGQYSLKLSTLSANRICTVAPQIAVTTQGIPSALPSTTYSYSFWMKTNKTSGDSAGAYIDFLERNGAGNAGTSHLSTQVNTTTDWTYYSGSFTTASTCRFITPKLFVEGNTGTATLIMDAWFDDITLVKSPVQTRTAVAVEPLPLVNAGFETAPPFTAATNVITRYIDGTAGGSATDVGYKWSLNSCTNSEAKFDSAIKYTGNYSMKLSTLSSGAIVTASQLKADIGFTVKPNTTYIMSYRIKTQLNSGSSSSGAYGYIARKKSDNTTISITYGTSVLTTQDWTTYYITVTTTPETAYLEPAVSINGSNGAGTLIMDAWFDDIEIKEVIPQRKTPDNLLSNGNFEYAPPFTAAQTTAGNFINGTATGSASNNSPYIWGFQKGNTATAQFDSTVSKFGTNSMKITTGSASAYGEVNLYGPFVLATTKNTLIPVLPSTAYTISWWMKTEYVSGDASQGATVGLIEYNGIPGSTTFNSGTTIKTTTDWTYYSYTITTQSTTRFFNVQARIYGHNGTGTLQMNAWFDDITLTKTYPVKSTRSLVDNTVIYNGNFEYVPTGTTATTSGGAWIDGTATGATNKGEFGWVIFNYTGSWAAKFDTTEKYSGTASMKISTTAVSSTVGVANQEGIAASSQINNMPIAPSTSYTLSFKMKTLVNSGSATTGAYLSAIGYKVDGFSGASGFTGTTSSTAVNTTTDWTEYSITFTTASTAYYLRPELRIIGNNGTGTLIMDAWFDDLTLVKN